MVKKRLILAATAVSLWFAAFSASAAAYTSITVFGDSLSDGGNVNLYTNALIGASFPPPPYAQRFTNGPTAVENLAAGLGLPLSPSMAGGSNYAYGGAESGLGNYLRVRPNVPPIINQIFSGQPAYPDTGVLAQVADFTSAPPAGFGGPDDLVVLWAGSNDLFTVLETNLAGFIADPAGTVISPAMNNLAQSVVALYAAGARTLLMPNLPNIGVTPFGLGIDPTGFANFSFLFNLFLDATLDSLETTLAGLDIIESDTFSLLNQVVGNAAAYGFTNWTEPCYDGVSACANPDEYVFWDTVHPTAHTHAILGAALIQAVPEPPALVLVSAGLIGLLFSRRIRPSP